MTVMGLIFAHRLINDELFFYNPFFFILLCFGYSLLVLGIYRLLYVVIARDLKQSISKRAHMIFISSMLLGLNSGTLYVLWSIIVELIK